MDIPEDHDNDDSGDDDDDDEEVQKLTRLKNETKLILLRLDAELAEKIARKKRKLCEM